MDTKFTNSRESLDNARLADTDWAGLTLAERITSVELDGYVVIPNTALDPIHADSRI